MKDLITVATFTIREAVKRKSFIISMIIIIALIIIGFNIPNILDHLLGESEYKENVLIVDEDDIFEESLIDIQTGKEDYNYTISKEALSEEEIKTKLKSDEYDSCLIFKKKDDDSIKIDYVVESMMAGQTVPEDLIQNFSVQYTAVQIQKAGITQSQMEKMFTNFDINVIQTDESAASGNIVATMILSLVLFYAIYFCAYQVSTSITTEKTSKIMETLVTSTSPKTMNT